MSRAVAVPEAPPCETSSSAGAIFVDEAHELVVVGGVELTAEEGQAVDAAEAVGDDQALVSDAVSIAVGQGDDLTAVFARHTHIGYVQHAGGAEGHKARAEEAIRGEDVRGEAGREIERQGFVA